MKSRFIEQHEAMLVDFTEAITTERFWHIYPLDSKEPCGLYDSETGLRYPAVKALENLIKCNDFLFVFGKDNRNLATFATQACLLWHQDGHLNSKYHYSTVNDRIKKFNTPGLSDWQVPDYKQLKIFSGKSGNPHKTGKRLLDQYSWLTQSHTIDLDNWNKYSHQSHSGFLFACSPQWQEMSLSSLIVAMADVELSLATVDKQTKFEPKADGTWQQLSCEALFQTLSEERVYLRAVQGGTRLANPIHELEQLDWIPCRLPKLDRARLSDPHKGLWELWGDDKSTLDKLGLVARNPATDIKLQNVAIDFGTSCTVVAYCDEYGSRRLLRIGVRDFFQTPQASDFENPTMLEFLDYRAFSATWHQEAYSPSLNWDWVRASHEARETFRNNPGDTATITRILPKIKQWAMRSEKERILLSDHKGLDIELPALTHRNPVVGEPMTVSDNDPFDPVELYAWYLGKAINFRERGVYLKYYMSFPAKYQRDTKDKILASFRRGLQRSLPVTLINQPEILHRFEVKELASEPTAFAAAAMPQLGLHPTDEGIAYAVFDFGGGTTDFDYGLWRWADETEEQQGFEQVFESLHSSGDNFLGGENLLEHLIYSTFQHNLEQCRQHKIPFTRPLDGERFSGDEVFVNSTLAAQTNSVILASILRDFMESDNGKLDGQCKLRLVNVNGQNVECEFSLDSHGLNTLLHTRIARGLKAFFLELAEVIDSFADKPVHVLLAGNGSRSRHLKQLMEEEPLAEILADVFGAAKPPKLEIHPLLDLDQSNHHAPTAKTGGALGLLRLCPGEGIKLIDRVRTECRDEAPFRYYVGGMRRGTFEASLTPSSAYQNWTQLGIMPQNVYKMCYSSSPRAKSGMMEGDPEMRNHRIDFPAAPMGSRLFARAIKPTQIELAAAQDLEELSTNAVPTQQLDLEHGLIIS